jgi:hypothetical protein
MNDREWTMNSDSGWYWDHDLGTYAYATGDGMLTPETLGKQIAYSDRILPAEADFFAMAAELLDQRCPFAA